MAGRVILGLRDSAYGLFVSQKDIEVTNTSLTTPLAFDSRAVRGLMVSAKGEGSLAPAASNANSVDSPTSVNISHGLGYAPAYAVRWCIASELSSGVATVMRSPAFFRKEETVTEGDDEEPEESVETEEYGCTTEISTSNLTIKNHYFGASKVGDGSEYYGQGKQTIYYAYIIFKAKHFGTEL
jgi:hypothetical protein